MQEIEQPEASQSGSWKRISKLKRSMEAMRLKNEQLQGKITRLKIKLARNQEESLFLLSENSKLKEKEIKQEKKIRKLKERNEENDAGLQNVRNECKLSFRSLIEPNFVQKNSSIISTVQQLYESNSQLDKIQHCPAIAYMNSAGVPQTTTSNYESDNGPPPKRSKTDKNTMEKYDKASLKDLVKKLELRHRNEYDLWRNVLWALKEYGLESGYDTFEIAYAFSRRSSNYKDLEDLKNTFDSSDGTKSLQYLIDISKIFEEGLERMTTYLETIVPEDYLPLTVKQVDFRDISRFLLTVQSAKGSRVLFIIPHLYVLTTQNEKKLDFLQTKIDSKSSALGSLCAEMKEGYTARLTSERYEFRAKKTTLVLNNPLDGQNAFITYPNGKNGKNTRDLRTIRMALREETLKLLTKMSGKPFEYDKNDYIQDANGLELNAKRSDMDLITALFDADPDLKDRYSSTKKEIYHCDPETNLWDKIGEKTFNCHLLKYLTKTIKLAHTEQKYINKTTAITKLRRLFLGEVENLTFDDKLNSNLRLFFTTNRTIDTSSIPPTIRRIKVDDLAKLTSGWSYSSELAATYKESVQSYFNKLFPKPYERDWVLSFLAQMLKGERTDGHFLILFSDELEGKTGKTTLKLLLRAVFGNYYLANSKIVINRATYERDNFNGGMNDLQDKRLLVADDLKKTDTLNCHLIKAVTDESNYIVKFKKNSFASDESECLVQAGIIIFCSDNNLPKFNKSDRDFVKRLVACPMRSRFVSKEQLATIKTPNIYVADDSIKTQIPEWRSATLDLLIKYYKESVPTTPDSMASCKKSMSDLYRDFTDWLDDNLSETQDENAFVTATEIMSQMMKSTSDKGNQFDVMKLKADMAAWAKKCDYKYKSRHVYRDKRGKRHEAKSAILKLSII